MNKGELTLAQSVFLDTPNPKFAPYLYIVEVCETGLLIRMMGTKLVELWGRDRAGESLGHDCCRWTACPFSRLFNRAGHH